MQLVIDPLALDELSEAAKWYFDKSPLAAENFQREITEAFKYLQTFFCRAQESICRYSAGFIKSVSITIFIILKKI